MMQCLLFLAIGFAMVLAITSTDAAEDDAVEFETVLHGQQSGIHEAGDFVIAGDSAWTAFWTQAHNWILPPPDPPEIDLSDQVIIVAAAGQKPNGCYRIAITRIEADSAGNYTVHVADYLPPPDMMCTMALVYPVHAVRAPIPDGEVRFIHTEVVGTPADSTGGK